MKTRTENVGGITVEISQENIPKLDTSIDKLLLTIAQSFQKSLTHLESGSVNPTGPEAKLISAVDGKLEQLFNVEKNLLQKLQMAGNEYSKIVPIMGETRENQIETMSVIKDLNQFPAKFSLAHKSHSKLVASLDSLVKLGVSQIPKDEKMKGLLVEINRDIASITIPKVKQQATDILLSYQANAKEIIKLQKLLQEEKKRIFGFCEECNKLDEGLVNVNNAFAAAAKKIIADRSQASVPGFMHSNQASRDKAQVNSGGNVHPAPPDNKSGPKSK
jgi:hypothetical protein